MRSSLVAMLLVVLAAPPAGAQQKANRPPNKKTKKRVEIPPPAWQRGDRALAAKAARTAGRHIFQRACTSCHAWGPEYFSRDEWKEYLQGFPDNHDPDVRKEYAGMAAMFAAGKGIPAGQQRVKVIESFLVSAAPTTRPAAARRERPFDGLPQVGLSAPDFSITDVTGRKISLKQLKGKKHLVLVFSRAHW